MATSRFAAEIQPADRPVVAHRPNSSQVPNVSANFTPAGQSVPSLAIVKILHGPQGWIRLARGPNMKPFLVLQQDDKHELSTFVGQDHNDIYYTIQGAKMPVARGTDVSILNACYADIDLHDSKHNGKEVANALARLIRRGVLPCPSWIKRSGRGYWFFWLLRQVASPWQRPAATHDNIRLWRAVQSGINKILAGLGSDHATAVSLFRYTRLEGSINSKSGSRVKSTLIVDRHRNIPRYTLDELAKHFKIWDSKPKFQVMELQSTRRSAGATQEKSRQAAMRRLCRFEHLLSDLRRLAELRGGGYWEGTRHWAIAYVSVCLKNLGHNQRQILVECRKMASLCLSSNGKSPLPFPETELRHAIRFRCTWPRNNTVSTLLKVNPDEAQQLAVLGCSPLHFPGQSDPPRPGRMEKARRCTLRLEEYVLSCHESGVKPTRRGATKYLKVVGLIIGAESQGRRVHEVAANLASRGLLGTQN